jgi:3-hydroxybutyryl-CoA dehydrogenase
MGDHDEELAIVRIGIIGAGQMGGGIAQVCALAGYEVFLQDVTMERVQQALKGITARLDRLAEKQKLTSAAGAEAIQRIRTGTELQLFRGCDLVIESAVENEPIKREIFKNLCPVLQDKALICTNTSSISVTALAAHTDRPERFMGMHFMNPVPVMRLVELIRALTTSDATYSVIKNLAAKLGKTAVTSQDYPAFIVNRVLLPMINEAIQAGMEKRRSAEQRNIPAAVAPPFCRT